MGGPRWLRWRTPGLQLCSPARPQARGEFGREGRASPGGFPHSAPAADIHLAQKARAGFVCGALGPEAIWGALGARRGSPRLPLKVGASAAAPEPHAGGSHIWPGRCLPIPTALSSPRAPGLALLANQGTKGNACRPTPSDGCPGLLLPGAL